MVNDKYRIITNGNIFRIERLESYTYRGGMFFLKKITRSEWTLCDCRGLDCFDDAGWYDEDEAVEFDSMDAARKQIEMWTTPPPKIVELTESKPVEPTWKVVWQKA